MGKKMHGRAAADKVVKVPIGTVIYRADAPRPKVDPDEQPADGRQEPPVSESITPPDGDAEAAQPRVIGPAASEPIADLTRDGQEFVLAKGGKGGKGNVHFKSSRNRAPVQYTEGDEEQRGY